MYISFVICRMISPQSRNSKFSQTFWTILFSKETFWMLNTFHEKVFHSQIIISNQFKIHLAVQRQFTSCINYSLFTSYFYKECKVRNWERFIKWRISAIFLLNIYTFYKSKTISDWKTSNQLCFSDNETLFMNYKIKRMSQMTGNF